MKFQDDISNMNTYIHTYVRTYIRTSRNQYAPPHFFKVGGITKRPNSRVFCQKEANGIANSEDPDQTAPLGIV